MKQPDFVYTQDRLALRELLADMLRDCIVEDGHGQHRTIDIGGVNNILVSAYAPPSPYRMHWGVRLNTMTGNPSLVFYSVEEAIERIVTIASDPASKLRSAEDQALIDSWRKPGENA